MMASSPVICIATIEATRRVGKQSVRPARLASTIGVASTWLGLGLGLGLGFGSGLGLGLGLVGLGQRDGARSGDAVVTQVELGQRAIRTEGLREREGE